MKQINTNKIEKFLQEYIKIEEELKSVKYIWVQHQKYHEHDHAVYILKERRKLNSYYP